MKKIKFFLGIMLFLLITSCTKAKKEMMVIQKSADEKYITIQKMNSLDVDTCYLNFQMLKDKINEYHFSSKFILEVNKLKPAEMSRYVIHRKKYIKENSVENINLRIMLLAIMFCLGLIFGSYFS